MKLSQKACSWKIVAQTLSLLVALGREDVAGAADGADDARVVRVRLDLPADARDSHVDGPVKGVGIAGVGEIEQPLAREHAPRVVGEGLEEIELRGGKRVIHAIVVLEQARLEIEPFRAE